MKFLVTQSHGRDRISLVNDDHYLTRDEKEAGGMLLPCSAELQALKFSELRVVRSASGVSVERVAP